MNLVELMVQGVRQALAARKLVLLLWLVNLVAAVPATLLLSASLAESFSSSLVAERLRQGFDTGWFGEFEAQASGLETTFSPTVSGAGPVLDNLEAWWTGELFTNLPGLVALGVSFALFWAFLTGGVLERLAQQQIRPQERMTLGAFAGAGGRTLARFCGLALLSAPLYGLIYALGRWLYGVIKAQTADVTKETTILLLVMMVAVLVIFLLNFVRLVFDYAKIVIVLENQRNIFRSTWAALRLVLRHPLRTVGLYCAFGALAMLLLAAYAVAAPGAGQSTLLGVVLAFLLGQLYLIARLLVRVGLLAGQLRFYRMARRPAAGV